MTIADFISESNSLASAVFLALRMGYIYPF